MVQGKKDSSLDQDTVSEKRGRPSSLAAALERARSTLKSLRDEVRNGREIDPRVIADLEKTIADHEK